MSDRMRYGAWIVASAAAGLTTGLAIPCGGGDVRLALAIIALPTALYHAPIIRWFGGDALRWTVLTTIGVFISFLSTIVGFVAVNIGLYALGLLNDDPSRGMSADAYRLVSSMMSSFIGGATLGLLQLPALARTDRGAGWVFATMLGSAALGPLAFAVVGFFECPRPLGQPAAVIGAAAGLLYGLVTAVALGMRLSTWTNARPRPPLAPGPDAPSRA